MILYTMENNMLNFLHYFAIGFVFIFLSMANGLFLTHALFWLADLYYGVWGGWLLYLVSAVFPVMLFAAGVYGIGKLMSMYIEYQGLWR